MKKWRNYALLLPLCLATTIKSAVGATGTGNFNISLTVTAGTCTVDSSTSIQDFGYVFAGDIKGRGAYKNFSLTLSNCSYATSKVTATFSGNADATSPSWYYKNMGTATGISIELATRGGGSGLGNGKSMTASVDSSRKATFNLSTSINQEANPMPGTILSTITVTYSYS